MKLKITEGCQVKTKSGREGRVTAVTPMRTGARGRPKSIVTVAHDEGEVTYSVSDLKILADISA